MAEKVSFIRWLIIACVTDAGLFILWKVGLLQQIWEQDASFLSSVIFAFFLFMSTYLGIATWRASKGVSNSNMEELGWFSSELCLGMGMLGTVIGLIMMLSGFNTLDATNVTSIQQLLTELGGSMGTALYTTVTGLACGINIKVQTFNLSLAGKIETVNE